MKSIKYSLRMTEERPTKISLYFIEGEFMKDNKGTWLLEPAGEGQTKATYNIEMTLGPLVPKTIVNAMVDTSLPKMLEAVKKRVESIK
jgi:coenzyme Q-binding protein COQ10